MICGPVFPLLTPVNFNSTSPPQPCIFAGIDIQPKGILKDLCEAENLSWSNIENLPPSRLVKIVQNSSASPTHEFIYSKRADVDFADCLSPFNFQDQIVTSYIGLVCDGPWFSSAHIEVGGGASYAFLNSGLKFWCSTTSNSASRLFERCCDNVNSFLDLLQRGPREKEARCLRFTIQRPGDLIYIPPLRPHAVLTIDTGALTILSGWDASTISDSTIITRVLDEYTVGVRRGTWRKILRSQGREELKKWVFSPAVGPQSSKEELQQHWMYWETHCPQLLANLTI